MLFKTLSDFANATNKAITNASFRSLNKTYSKVNTQFKRQVKAQTGLSTNLLNKRFKVKKATKSNLRGFVSMGTKFGIALDNFKPKIKIIRGKNKRKYKGVSIKIGTEQREVVKGAFLATLKSGKSLILIRKGKGRLPVTNPKKDFYPIAKQLQPNLLSFANAEYKSQYQTQLKYELTKR